MKRVVLCVTFALIMTGTFAVFRIGLVRAQGSTIYIRAEGNIDPPTAPISTLDNITYTFTADILGLIEVQRNNIVVDGAGHALDGTGIQNGRGISLQNLSRVTIKNINIRNFQIGISMEFSSNNTLSENNMTVNHHCIWLYGSFGNTLCDNKVTANGWDGISLYSSSNNTLSGNNVTANRHHGVTLSYSSNNTLLSNNLAANKEYGVQLYYSSNNTLSDNEISTNHFGITLESSVGNTLSGNNVTANARALWLCVSSNNTLSGNNVANNDLGIWLYGFGGVNKLYHNNIVNNSMQTLDETYATNDWDNGCEGNYWSDYNGTDSNNDGIGDIPYVIDGNNTDNYPLMNIYWNPSDINHDLKVDMKDIGRSARAFGTVPGDILWNPHADITGPEYLVPDGMVDMRDISLIARHFGEHYP